MVTLRAPWAPQPWRRRLARAAVYRAPGESESCPTCHSPRLFELDLLTVRRQQRLVTGFVSGCDDCGLVFSNPLPSAAELRAMYTPEGDWGKPRADDSAPPAAAASTPGEGGTSWARVFDAARGELSVLSPPAGSRVLDFGCGTGELLDRLQECGWETSGIEPAIDAAFPRHQRLERVPDAPAFDLIVAHHVLEHVADPLALLRAFAAASRPGAFLLVGVPRFDTLPDHRDYKYVINGHAHVTAYTWPCLHTLLARAGWSPVAPPPDRIPKGGGRTTAARIRVIARRRDGSLAPPSPAAAARAAMRAFHAASPPRPLLHRLGLYRLSARQIERRRRRDIQARKAQRAESRKRAG